MVSKANIARQFARKNENIAKTELAKTIAEKFGYSLTSAYRIIKEKDGPPKRHYGHHNVSEVAKKKGGELRKLLDEEDRKEQEAYERKMLEAELSRPKFFF